MTCPACHGTNNPGLVEARWDAAWRHATTTGLVGALARANPPATVARRPPWRLDRPWTRRKDVA